MISSCIATALDVMEARGFRLLPLKPRKDVYNFSGVMLRNTLFYGDNLPVLRNHISDASVDLVYLDPPFNSNASYNILFKEQSGEKSPAQIKAFTDTWGWTEETERAFLLDIFQHPGTPDPVKKIVRALLDFLGRNSMMAYLVMMTPRLVELRRVLKATGSLYLHCDPTSSHYLKVLLDAVFGPQNFRTEIIWKRTSAHSDTKQGRLQHGRVHDTILFYTRGENWTWNPVYTPYDAEYVEQFYRHVEPETGRRYQLGDLTGPGGAAKGNPHYQLMGVTRYWRYSKERMEELVREGRVVQTSPGTAPRYKRYLDEMPGVPVQDVWTDIKPIGAQARERLGYPTQKPEALLERIIQASSNPGDVLLDGFCGCGTAVAAAEKLGRQWIGIDITHLAVSVMKNRLKTMFDLAPGRDYDVMGEPQDVGGARALAQQDPFQFQYWAVSLLQAQPREAQKRGADRGVDGVLYFSDFTESPRLRRDIDSLRHAPNSAVVQVKSGRHISSRDIRDLKGVVEREQAALGLFITLEEPSRDMRTEAASGGIFHSQLWDRDFPRIQIRTIDELLQGNSFDLPPHQPNYQPAEKVRRSQGRQGYLEELASA